MVVRERQRTMDERTSKGNGNRVITAYPLVDQPASLQPVAEERAWANTNEPGLSARRTELTHNSTAAELDFAHAGRQGWWLCCPVAFTATWNGGSNG